jgi:quercetin dioxygenase-like cupin family protein
MKLVHQSIADARPNAGELFIGSVLAQPLVGEEDAPSLRVSSITFQGGAKNRWHRHTTEQVLVVTHGRGIVANDEQEYQVQPGDVILIPAGERHWHGAAPGTDLTHLSILLPGEMTIDD